MWGGYKRPNPKDEDGWRKAFDETTRVGNAKFSRLDAMSYSKRQRVQYESFSVEDRVRYAIQLAEGRA